MPNTDYPSILEIYKASIALLVKWTVFLVSSWAAEHEQGMLQHQKYLHNEGFKNMSLMATSSSAWFSPGDSKHGYIIGEVQ
jgi:hypothetical protein